MLRVQPVHHPAHQGASGDAPAHGRHTIEVDTSYAELRPAGPLDITLKVDGDVVASGLVPISAPLLFTANDCLDVGTCLGSPVSLAYHKRAPFPFNGTIHRMHVAYQTP